MSLSVRDRAVGPVALAVIAAETAMLAVSPIAPAPAATTEPDCEVGSGDAALDRITLIGESEYRRSVMVRTVFSIYDK